MRIITVFAALLAGVPAYAGTVLFDFNSLGVSSGDNSAAVAAYMTTQMHLAGCATCSISVSTIATDQTYNGDGHVVGPKFNNAATSLTLGNSDGATNNNGAYNTQSGGTSLKYDTFLANTTDGKVQLTDHFSFTFTGFTISSAAFDFEIFPDASGPNDLSLSTGVYGSDTLVSGFGVGGTVAGVAPGGGNGSSMHSQISGLGSNEASPQYIGHWSGSVGSNVANLNFIDWPATIGVDNLSLTFDTPNPSSVPEPGSFLLLGTVAAGLFVIKRKVRKA